MTFQIRLSPIQPTVKDSALKKFFENTISFTKLERMKTFKTVILSFDNDQEAESAFGKLQGIKWGEQDLEILLIGDRDPVTLEKAPSKEEIRLLPKFQGSTNDLKILIKHAGPDLVKEDMEGRNLLHLITDNPSFNQEQTKLLLKSGFKVNAKDKYLRTPLHHSKYANNSEVLLINGADSNALDVNGWSPMHFASNKGYIDNCELLLNHGADINVRAKDGKTPWDVRFESLTCENTLYKLGARSGLGVTVQTIVEEPRLEWFWNQWEIDPNKTSDERIAFLTKNISTFSLEEITVFISHYLFLLSEGYRRSVCGFCLAVNADSTDDGFENFLSWIISKGKKFYYTALMDANKLADELMDFDNFEEADVASVLKDSYTKISGVELEDIHLIPSTIKFSFKADMTEEDFDWSEQQLKKKFPKLVKRFHE
jgi:hypothetical protein